MDQIAWGHAVRPDATFDELVASVQIERHVLDAQHCPELGEILDTIPAPSSSWIASGRGRSAFTL